MFRLALVPVLALALAAGCHSGPPPARGNFNVPVRMVPGVLFAQYRTPVTTDFHATKVGERRGQYDISYIDLWFLLGIPNRLSVSYGFDDVYRAARAGGIAKIDQVDLEYMHVLGIYHRVTLILHGE